MNLHLSDLKAFSSFISSYSSWPLPLHQRQTKEGPRRDLAQTNRLDRNDLTIPTCATADLRSSCSMLLHAKGYLEKRRAWRMAAVATGGKGSG